MEPGTSGSVARNSDHWTTEAVNCTHEAEWTPFQIHYFSENLVASGIEPRALDLSTSVAIRIKAWGQQK
jgi:hypothetical protein